MSTYSAWRLHNKDLFSNDKKNAHITVKTFTEPMKVNRKLLSKSHGVAAGTRVRSVSKETCHNPSPQEHILHESPLRAPQVALEHVPARTSTHSNPAQMPF